MLSIQNMTADVTFEHFCHETVHGSPRCTHDLEHFRAIALFVERSYESLNLSLNTFGTKKQVVLLFDRVAHPLIIPYPVWYMPIKIAPNQPIA